MRPLSLIGANGGFFHDSTRRRSTLHGMDQGAMIYDLGVGWRDAAVVSADCGIATVRRDRHPHYARICCDEMGIRLADRVYRRGWCVSLRSRLPRAAARAARTLRFRALGSAMHCVAGDGVGIFAGAVLSSLLHLGGVTEMILEYMLGFAFGWMIFQALFMRDMAGGSFSRALVSTFVPELVSMNFLMAGMLPAMMALRRCVPSADNPLTPAFWFVMSMALLVGFVVAYPINWWLVANHLKHGMMTVRPASAGAAPDHAAQAAGSGMSHDGSPTPVARGEDQAPSPPVPVMTLLSFLVLAAGAAVAFLLRPL